jgi:threonine aldolase
MGGGMRQAGVIAAAGIVALKTMPGRLAEDHEHAQILAASVAATRLKIDLNTVQTNIVIFDTAPLGQTAAQFIASLAAQGVRAGEFGKTRVRMVTHRDISRNDIEKVAEILWTLAK